MPSNKVLSHIKSIPLYLLVLLFSPLIGYTFDLFLMAGIEKLFSKRTNEIIRIIVRGLHIFIVAYLFYYIDYIPLIYATTVAGFIYLYYIFKLQTSLKHASGNRNDLWTVLHVLFFVFCIVFNLIKKM